MRTREEIIDLAVLMFEMIIGNIEFQADIDFISDRMSLTRDEKELLEDVVRQDVFLKIETRRDYE